MSQTSSIKVSILLGIWGESYIINFLNLGLSSLLAPGNIPTLAAGYKTRFILLTRESEINLFEIHPAFQKLLLLCEVEFIAIDDLISFSNSTTLTLAYNRAIQNTGVEMLETYFLFLTSDYIMADGSLTGLMRYMAKGYSGICAGNFQVIKEDIQPFLFSKINQQTLCMQISPRELLTKSLQSLHPIVFASLLEQDLIHNYYANRFFLRYNRENFAGRFYLLHMLCIKPETMDYQIGSSCDYSFIPEMCPSGNIAIINDSDEYFVIETQKLHHEFHYINAGPYDSIKITSALAEWTTLQHRKNIQQTIYYHINDISDKEKLLIDKKMDASIKALIPNLESYKAQSHRDHPYWVGAIEAFHKHKKLIDGKDFEYKDITQLERNGFKETLLARLFGVFPNVYPWHYRWQECRSIINHLKVNLPPEMHKHTLVLYASYDMNFVRYYQYLRRSTDITHHYEIANLKKAKKKLEELQNKPFEICLIFALPEDIKYLKDFLDTLNTLLKKEGKVLIFIPNPKIKQINSGYNFEIDIFTRIFALTDSKYVFSHLAWIRGDVSLLGAYTVNCIRTFFQDLKILRRLFFLLLTPPGILLGMFLSFLLLLCGKKGHSTHVLLTLKHELDSAESNR